MEIRTLVSLLDRPDDAADVLQHWRVSDPAAARHALLDLAEAGVPLDPIQIYETVEIRKIHEIKAAELACSRATEENFERLREILRESEAQLDKIALHHPYK